MGFSHAIAAAIVFGGVAVGAYQVTDAWLESRGELDTAWLEANERRESIVETRVDITSVTRTGAIVTVRADNTGTETIDGGGLTIFFNGAPMTMLSRQVEGKTTDVWAAGQEISIRVTSASTPASVTLVGATGMLDAWRS